MGPDEYVATRSIALRSVKLIAMLDEQRLIDRQLLPPFWIEAMNVHGGDGRALDVAFRFRDEFGAIPVRFSLDRSAGLGRNCALRPVQFVRQDFALNRGSAGIVAPRLNPEIEPGLVYDQGNRADRDGLMRRLAPRRVHLPSARKIGNALRRPGKRQDQRQSE